MYTEHTGRENKTTQVLSTKFYNLAGKLTFISTLFIILICSFELTCNNLSSCITCSNSHTSAESLLICPKHGITYGINSCLSLSICRASEWQELVQSSAQFGYYSSSASSELWVFHNGKIRFLPLLKGLCSFAVIIFFGEYGYSPKTTVAWIYKIRWVIFLKCNCKTKVYS